MTAFPPPGHYVVPLLRDEPVDKAELLALVTRMRKVNAEVYDLFFRANMGGEVHAFIEFCGVLGKYVDLCERAAHDGIDFRHANVHGSDPFPVEVHDARYLGEKLACIFAPMLRDPEIREALHDELFGRRPAPPISYDVADVVVRALADPAVLEAATKSAMTLAHGACNPLAVRAELRRRLVIARLEPDDPGT